ncbi:unnamed protein product [Closterium sp. Naga37s-1]|nr:unnamed protein product [Closterium sp. Naga37s-1]
MGCKQLQSRREGGRGGGVTGGCWRWLPPLLSPSPLRPHYVRRCFRARELRRGSVTAAGPLAGSLAGPLAGSSASVLTRALEGPLAGSSAGLLTRALAGPPAGPSVGLLALPLAGPSAGLLAGPSACTLAGAFLAFLVHSWRSWCIPGVRGGVRCW